VALGVALATWSGLQRRLKRSEVLVNCARRAGAVCRAFLARLSPEILAAVRFRWNWGRWPDFRNPQTFDEKLLWLMRFWRHPLKTSCADKYAVRSYVEEHGLGHMLPNLLGVWESSAAIDFDALPDRFVLKCTHGCGCNIICKAKSALDRRDVRSRLDRWMRVDYSRIAGEVHYALIKPRIIAETFLDAGAGGLPDDYKLYCFNGAAHCTMVCTGRATGQPGFDFYDREWKVNLPYSKSSALAHRQIPEPAGYREMLAAAETLSKPFPFVRMDFYSIAGRAIVGEMTFTPHGCIDTGYTDLAQRELGRLIDLPQPHIVPPGLSKDRRSSGGR
jgi:hypothetical protein